VASKAQKRLLQRKEAKQKKLLLFLAPVLLGLLVWQGPGMLSAFTGGGGTKESTAPPAPTFAPPPPGGAAPAPPAAATPPAPGQAGAQPPAAAPEEAGLPDTDVPVEAEQGQLVTFSRFVGKDPFKQQLLDAPEGGSPPPPGAPPASGTIVPPPPPPPPGAAGSSASTETGATSARIEVNGAVETVRVRATFPAGDPVFRLASISGGTVRIGLISGSFEGGAKTVEVGVGESVVLVSQPDGLRYRIKILRLGT
jgi:hypothetical protein